jgi:hypothetical protein
MVYGHRLALQEHDDVEATADGVDDHESTRLERRFDGQYRLLRNSNRCYARRRDNEDRLLGERKRNFGRRPMWFAWTGPFAAERGSPED